MNKKIITPIIIGILFSLYLIFIFGFYFIIEPFNKIFLIVQFLICSSLIALMIYVVIQRIKEIKGGEEDDISKY